MTLDGKIEPTDVIETASLIMEKRHTSYAVIEDETLLIINNILGSIIQGMHIQISLATDNVVKDILISSRAKYIDIKRDIEKQMVINRQLATNKATA
jgi:hypothetical protein